MKKMIAYLLLAAMLLSLCGCSALLEREYTQSEPHSEKYWDAGDSSVLRAENHQELVNDILTLLSAHAENARIRLYAEVSAVEAEDMMEEAAREVQEETALGAYALDYLSYSVSEAGSYVEISAAISYRRSAEQVAGIISVTSSSAVSDMLRTAVETKAEELVLRIRYFNASEQEVETTLRTVEAESGVEVGTWQLYFYPSGGDNRIIEFIFAENAK